jgi:hypothetical protein
LVLAFALAGCTTSASQNATPVAASTISTTVSATATLTQAPTPSLEATRSPSATPAQPTQSPSATPTESTPTTAPSQTATATPAEPTPTTVPSATATPLPSLTPTSPPSRTPAPTVTPSPTAVASWWEVATLLVGPGNPGRLYAFQRLAYSYPIGPVEVRLLISDDGGQTWSPFPGGLPAQECLHNVNMDYARVDGLNASTCRGLYRWSGSSWDLISAQETTMVAVVYGQPQILWAIEAPGQGAGVIRSDDGGVTWTPADTNLVSFNGVATLGIDPTDANRLFAIIMPKYAGSYLRRGNGKGVWEMMPTPNHNTVIDPGMAIDGATGNLYVVTSLNPYQLWISRNPGADLTAIEWEILHTFDPDVWVHLLASGPGPNGPTLYANLTTIRQLDADGLIDVGPALLRRSQDAGQNWTAIPIPTGNP